MTKLAGGRSLELYLQTFICNFHWDGAFRVMLFNLTHLSSWNLLLLSNDGPMEELW